MPELPEVEVVRMGLTTHVVGRTIQDITWSNKKLRMPVPRAFLDNLIKGRIITRVDRRGKYLLFRMDNNASLVIHLGMSGKLSLFSKEQPLRKHDHLRFHLDNGVELRFNDARRFGSVQVLPPGADETNLLNIKGVEPLSRNFSKTYLAKMALHKTKPVKNFLMDGAVVLGIGNIYASETLFIAGINPNRESGCISATEWAKIIRAGRAVLKKAIKFGGTTISDFVNSSNNPGYFQNQLMVYGREGKPCPKCKRQIIRQVMAGRATYFCPHCQKV
ncbi:MAG: bifunctional DNA-formamidopyrimidine glycosylase/DNA-(apurinic or apyrimidinic site) lyase [Proteobacteria bacterium]|nr:bifunctional DNA-formamidopyrimidine glycosylase/DNA-(apurinic or apyrimidinic site) lyase [Pseudomonadota bacterium]